MTQSNVASLHHLFEGPEDAPVLVMSNSLGTTLRMWDGQARALRERFRLLRYDHRGHGGSSVPPGPYRLEDIGRDLLALLDASHIERVSLCGLSLGGMVGMWLASEAPERVERLALCCTSARLGPKEMWDERAATARRKGVGALADGVLERWFTPDFRAERPEVVEKARRMLVGTPAGGYASCCEAIRDMDLRDRLGEIRAPALIIAGADDPATPPEHAELIHAAIPGSRLEVIPAASHLANIERPEVLTASLMDHLAPVVEGRRT